MRTADKMRHKAQGTRSARYGIFFRDTAGPRLVIGNQISNHEFRIKSRERRVTTEAMELA